MDKKILVGIFALVAVALIGASFVAANGIGFFGVMPIRGKLNQTQIDSMKNFTASVQTAIKNKDYATWKSLMEGQLTQDNFNRLVGAYQNRVQMMQNKTQWNNGFRKGFMMDRRYGSTTENVTA